MPQHQPHPLSVPRCKRMVRPLLSKVHSLTDLHSKYPVKLVFDGELFGSGDPTFNAPGSAAERLVSLKPFVSPEAYGAYTEIFTIFRNIVGMLYGGARRTPTRGNKAPQKTRPQANGTAKGENRRVPSLAFLAAQKLGKSVALGTKSTHYSLHQTALFDPASIPLYLRKYHGQLAEDIDEWLQMEPVAVFRHHRADLLLGYVLHILVFNSRMLFYPLVPVLCHWLHEQHMASSRSLFIEYWHFSHLDPDHEEVQDLAGDQSRDPSTATFWLFHRSGYWQSLVSLLGVRCSEYGQAGYDALFLETLVQADRLDLSHIDVHEVYALMRTCLQHPKNTAILVSVIAQIITDFRRSFKNVSTSWAAHDLLHRTYRDVRHFVQAWLALSKSCIFNTLDKGNGEIFGAVFSILGHLSEKCASIVAYLDGTGKREKADETARNFETLRSKIANLSGTCKILEAFYLDTRLQSGTLESPSMVKYFVSFAAEECDGDTVDVFVGWLDEQNGENNTAIAALCTQLALLQQ